VSRASWFLDWPLTDESATHSQPGRVRSAAAAPGPERGDPPGTAPWAARADVGWPWRRSSKARRRADDFTPTTSVGTETGSRLGLTGPPHVTGVSVVARTGMSAPALTTTRYTGMNTSFRHERNPLASAAGGGKR
jgi:hypothetical protein